MTDKASNVRVVSNVYPAPNGVCNDPAFCHQIKGRAALKKLADFTCFGLNDDRDMKALLLERGLVTPTQIEAYWDGEYCSYCPVGERPFGLVTDGAKTWVECRCEYRKCPS